MEIAAPSEHVTPAGPPTGQRHPAPVGVTIRPEQSSDAPAIGAVHLAAFPPDEGPSVARLVEALRLLPGYDPELSLVAELDGRIVGHVMVGAVTLRDDSGDSGDRPIANLSPLGVVPDAQRRGIGSALVEAVVARAAARGEPLVVLEGDPAFYGRLGFVHSVPHGIRITLPSWARPECAQVRLLREVAPPLRGLVVYPPPFEMVSEPT